MEQSPEHLWIVLARCYHSVAEHARRNVQANGLGLSDFAALEALFHKGPLTISALGSKVLLTSGSMTTAVGRLAARGLVQRATDSADRRVQRISLTDQGRALFEPIFRNHQQALAEATASLTAEERSQLTTLLRKLGISAQQALRTGLAH